MTTSNDPAGVPPAPRTGPGAGTERAGPAEVAGLVEELRLRVEQRRIAGEYPRDIEDRLAHHFERVVSHAEPGDHLDELRAAVMEFRAVGAFSAERIEVASKHRMGEHYHRLVAQAVSRQVAGVLAQIQDFADKLRPVLEASAAQLEILDDFLRHDMAGRLDAALEGLERRELDPGDPAGELAALRTRVAVLEADRAWPGSVDERALQDRFEGDRTQRLESAGHLHELIGDRVGIVDLACGRGELLEILGPGAAARGFDTRAALVADAAARGLAAQAGEPLESLGALPDASLGAVVMAGRIDQLDPQSLIDLVSLATAKLGPGGVVVLGAENPAALIHAAEGAGSDPLRREPIGPRYLSFLCGHAGFTRVDLHWSTIIPPGALSAGADAGGALGDLVRQLNATLFPPTRFTLVAGGLEGS